jgi:hypothetical protein
VLAQRLPTYPPILQYNTPLPAEPPTVQFFYASFIAIDDLHVYFSAAGGNGSGSGSYGVYQENPDGSGLAAILNSTQPVGGLNPPYALNGGTAGITAENGTVVFSIQGVASDGSSAGALFAYQGGNLVRIAGTGDVLATTPGIYWAPPIAGNSINNGRIVFSFGNPGEIGVFLATPTSAGAGDNSSRQPKRASRPATK